MTKVHKHYTDKCKIEVEETEEGYFVIHLISGADFKLFKKVTDLYRDKPFMSTTPVGHRTNKIVQRYFDFVFREGDINIYHIRRN